MLTWDEFIKQDSEAWRMAAASASKGKYDVTQLNYNVENDFIIDAFQTTSTEDWAFELGFISKSGLFVRVPTKEAHLINQRILNSLQIGIDSLVLEVEADVDLSRVLAGIYPDMVDLVILTDGDQSKLKTQIQSYLDVTSTDSSKSIEIPVVTPIRLSGDQKFSERLLVFRDCVNRLHAADALILRVALKQDFLAQIAELRAMRIVWHQSGRLDENLKIIATATGKSSSDVHPMIMANYQLMSAVLGGCNIVGPEMGEDDESVRLMLNMMHIFREESRLNLVRDPLAGAYLPEALTAEMVAFCNKRGDKPSS
ncbi:MAG: methylmalonyl-CoA mutase family protein [Chitinophagales bacterium]|nr:methylmalonyl-CoA mutase family protein [Chitinophagales bacterium]